jgi:DSF synthase
MDAPLDTTQIQLEYEPSIATIWLTLPIEPLPCITPSLIQNFCEVAEALKLEHGRETPSEEQPFKFLVIRSASDRVFSLGGDLVSMADTIEGGHIDVLDRTAVGGATASFNMASGFGCCFVTISLVRGRALGGGFETARCCNLMTAEAGAVFQLPEATVGLFPANGIGTVIAPRIGYLQARQLVVDAEKIDVATALEKGILDEVYEPGMGEAGVRSLIARLTAHHSAHVAYERTLQRQNNITLDALIAETDYWAKTVRHLSASSLARMRRVGMLQRRMFGAAAR